MNLSDLKPPEGQKQVAEARRPRHGFAAAASTSGRGAKGAKSISGYSA